jgi:hypothetical protein
MRVKIPLFKVSLPVLLLLIFIVGSFDSFVKKLYSSAPWETLVLEQSGFLFQYPRQWQVRTFVAGYRGSDDLKAIVVYDGLLSSGSIDIYWKEMESPGLGEAIEYGTEKIETAGSEEVSYPTAISIGDSLSGSSQTYNRYGGKNRQIYFASNTGIVVMRFNGGSRSYEIFDDEFEQILDSISLLD